MTEPGEKRALRSVLTDARNNLREEHETSTCTLGEKDGLISPWREQRPADARETREKGHFVCVQNPNHLQPHKAPHY